MEQNTAPAQKKGIGAPVVIVALIALLIIGGVAYTATNKEGKVMDSEQVAQDSSQTTDPNPTMGSEFESDDQMMMESGDYTDGTYEAVGEYQSPGGAESIDVELTLTDGVITDANVVSKAERPISQDMQAKFISGYKAEVVGKNIDDVELDVVSGSSLTPKGFNDAVEKIKEQAKA